MSGKRKYESESEIKEEEEEEEVDDYFDEHGRVNYKKSDHHTIDTARTIRSDPRLAEIFQEAKLDATDGDVCLGHAFATLMGQSIMGNNHDIVNLTIYPDDLDTRVLTYAKMVAIFSEKTPIPAGTSFFSGENISAHGTLICFYKNTEGKVFVWYYNPWGIVLEKDKMRLRTLHISSDAEKEVKTNYSGKYDKDLKEVFIIDYADKLSLRDLYAKHKEHQQEVVYLYMLQKMKHLLPDLQKEVERSIWDSDNTLTETLRMMNLFFKPNDVTVMPMEFSNAHYGVQRKYSDGIETQPYPVPKNTRACLEKTVQTNFGLGSCAIWVILYSKIVYTVLNGVEEKAMIIEVIRTFMPNVQLMGEDGVRVLLAKIVMINGVGPGIFETMRKFFELLPDKGEQGDDYFKIVMDNFDIAIGKIQEGWPKSRWFDQSPRKLADQFDPDRHSPRIEYVMEFIKSVVTKDISTDDSHILREAIVYGGYLTNSSWDKFMNILLLVISCKYREWYE